MKERHSFKYRFLSVLVALLLVLSMPITAQAASRKVSLKVSNQTVYVGSKKSLGVKTTKGAKVSYKTSNKAVAVVSKGGTVSGRKAGTAKITVTASRKGWKTAQKIFTVKVVKRDNKISASNKSVNVGKSVSLGAKAKGGKLDYKSSNTKVATVNSKGTVKGIKEGTAKIKISTKGNGTYKSVSKTVTVTVKHVHKYNKKVTPAKTEVIKHPEEGHWDESEFVETKPAYTETIPARTVYVCSCEMQFDTVEELTAHQDEMSAIPHDIASRTDTPEQVIDHPAEGYWTERTWVVDTPAYTETIPAHIVDECSCGFKTDTLVDGPYAMNDHWNSLSDEDFEAFDHYYWSYTVDSQEIYHEEVGHWVEPEFVTTKDAYTETIPASCSITCSCGETFNSEADYESHRSYYCEGHSSYSESTVPESTIDHPAEGYYQKEWVVDKPAWEETVTTPEKVSYVCSCGKKK